MNKAEDILEAFRPYYRTATLSECTEPNKVHDLKIKLDDARVYTMADIADFMQAFADPKKRHTALNPPLSRAADRFRALSEALQEDFRSTLGSFIRMYEFLSQIVFYDDHELESLAVFGRFLLRRIARRPTESENTEDEAIKDVDLTHYRIQKQHEYSLDLETGQARVALDPASEVGSGQAHSEEEAALSTVIERLNSLFEGNLTDSDMIAYVAQIKGRMIRDERLIHEANTNTQDQFALGSVEQVMQDIVIESMDSYMNMANQVINKESVQKGLLEALIPLVWEELRSQSARAALA